MKRSKFNPFKVEALIMVILPIALILVGVFFAMALL